MRLQAYFLAFLFLLLVSPVFAAPQANATITPRFVDTSVINQTFIYIIDAANETLNNIVINASGAHNFTGVLDVTLNGTSCRGVSGACAGGNVSSALNGINVSFDTPVVAGTVINVTFVTNTTASYNLSNFTATIINNNGQSLAIPSGLNSTFVFTQPMIAANITMTKGTAILNGSDYWEFKLTLGLAATQAGIVQFRMNDWIDAAGLRLNLNTSTDFYTTLRNESNFNTTGKFNVTTAYGTNIGINKTSTALTDFYLRMIIPSSAQPSNTWSSTYNLLFRATP